MEIHERRIQVMTSGDWTLEVASGMRILMYKGRRIGHPNPTVSTEDLSNLLYMLNEARERGWV